MGNLSLSRNFRGKMRLEVPRPEDSKVNLSFMPSNKTMTFLSYVQRSKLQGLSPAGNLGWLKTAGSMSALFLAIHLALLYHFWVLLMICVACELV